MITPLPTKDDVVKAIGEAFHGVEREDGVTLHEAREIDMYMGEEDRAEARKLDTEKVWEEVPASAIEEFSEALSFVDPKGFRYYIPAFMIWALTDGRTSGSSSGESAYFQLSDLDTGDEYHASRLALLNDSQRSAVAMFLLFGSETEIRVVADSVLRFWHKYLPAKFGI